MRYRHRFYVDAPIDTVASFHRRAASLGLLTPWPVVVKMEEAPEWLDEGDEITFALRLGQLSVHWRARIEGVSPTGFTDRQLSGPFRRWSHKHSFRSVDHEGSVHHERTEVLDEVDATLRWHPVWVLVGLGLWLTLPLLFAYRGRKTRQILEGKTRGPPGSVRGEEGSGPG